MSIQHSVWYETCVPEGSYNINHLLKSLKRKQTFSFTYFNIHPRICLLILERKDGREGGQKGGEEKGRGEGEERDVDVRNTNWLPLLCSLTGDWTHNLGMCPDQEWSPQPFSIGDNAPTNLATWTEAGFSHLDNYLKC